MLEVVVLEVHLKKTKKINLRYDGEKCKGICRHNTLHKLAARKDVRREDVSNVTKFPNRGWCLSYLNKLLKQTDKNWHTCTAENPKVLKDALTLLKICYRFGRRDGIEPGKCKKTLNSSCSLKFLVTK